MDRTASIVNAGTPPIPANEKERIAALHRFELLDTPSEPVFDRIVWLAAKLFNVPIALVSLIDEDRQWAKALVGLNVREIPRSHSFCAHAINGRDILVVEDATRDPRFASNPFVTEGNGVRFYAGAPLYTRDGYALGAVCVVDSKPHGPLSPEEKQALKDLSTLVMAHIEARQQIGYLSPITGLPNRYRFIDDVDAFIAECRSTSKTVAVLLIACCTPQEYADLARALGYGYADAFEVAAAEHIRRIIPARTKLYHVTNGRFCFVLPSGGRTKARRLAATLAKGLDRPLLCRDIPINVTASVGIAYYPGNGNDGEEILRAATSSTLFAQEQARPWVIYHAADDLLWQRRFRLLTDISAALSASGQLHLHYQPKIDLRSGRCVGAEALLRWNHPGLGAVPPGEFIPLIEHTALMRPVTEWVMEETFRQVAEWRRQGFGIPVSLNISVLDLETGDLSVTIAKLLKRYDVQPGWVDIEVTESGLIRNTMTQTAQQLSAIRELGLEIEIDDFGTGQSALSYLKHIPASVVKIDQLFVRHLDAEPKDQRIVRSTIELAHELGFQVTAEGIESESVFSWLKDQGCDVGQGYLMSRPLTPQAFRQWAEKKL